jgi:asparagine synthase (glutamine-hydrolysing)
MCGIVGCINFDDPGCCEGVAALVDALTHRGPDSAGLWRSDCQAVALGHRRLAILELSPQGAQPMRSSSGRSVICYNGEIYDHSDLRRELEAAGVQLRGNSDTEVLLELIELRGIDHTLQRINGMFAFAYWDIEQQSLVLARDRVGIKPLYFGVQKDTFVFCSELRVLRSWRDSPQINTQALRYALKMGYIPAPLSAYSGMYKLPPGSYLTLSKQALEQYCQRSKYGAKQEFEWYPVQKYWNLNPADPNLFSDRTSDTIHEEFDVLLKDAVKARMLSDVPLGAFLSGGIDSSLVVATMQSLASSPVQTFSIGFEHQDYDESPFARAVATQLGTDHTELCVTPAEALRLVPDLCTMYDEPFADSSQIPVAILSQLTRKRVTVSLSGDGGDELFCGYNRYLWAARLWRLFSRLPVGLKRTSSKLLASISPWYWNALFRAGRPILPDTVSFHQPGDKLRQFFRVLQASEFQDFYRELTSHWLSDEVGLSQQGQVDRLSVIPDWMQAPGRESECMMFWDFHYYLVDDLLVKLDRASMATSLEARVPLLDHRLVEFAWQLPLAQRMQDSTSGVHSLKGFLKSHLREYLPDECIDRPKKGFSVPLGDWLRTDLFEWGSDLLNDSNLCDLGLLDPALINQRWEQHQTGSHNWQHALWNWMMVESWLRAHR